MLYYIPPENIHKLDQRIAAMGESLDVCVDIYRANVDDFGQDQAMVFSSSVFLGMDKSIIADLLTVAVDRLSRET